jgi:ferric-dicitrate binding protein FerR (iron transport regulator)
MNSRDPLDEHLLRLLDGRLPAAERQAIERRLAEDPAARARLRTLAEEAVLLGDVERMVTTREAIEARPPIAWRPAWIWPWAAAALLVLGLAMTGFWFLGGGPVLARVTKVTGASGVFGKRGASEKALPAGLMLRAGDMIETRACDSWVELELRDGSRLTVAGHSMLRLLQPSRDSDRFSLLRGTLWRSPSSNRVTAPLVVETPASRVEAGGSQFDLQATSTETLLRVNAGRALLKHQLQQVPVEVPGGSQVEVTLASPATPVPHPQPSPVAAWSCDFGDTTAILLGRRLGSIRGTVIRMGAEPLLWPLPDRAPILLHAVSVSVLQSLGRPVELKATTRIRFTGRLQTAKTVRFGFSTQRMCGVFSGKFEVDVTAAQLGVVGEPWTVELPVAAFRPLHPELSPAPAGLELNDIYALTVIDDAGLELNRIEVLPFTSVPPTGRPSGTRSAPAVASPRSGASP